jgi:tetratricopeptide (TPR) repeat protein
MSDAAQVATAALHVFEANNDNIGQCRALRLRAHTEWIQGRVTLADEAWQRAAIHARAAGELRELFEILTWRASATAIGPIPVPEGIRLCEEIREEVRQSPVAVAVTIQPLAALHAMLGEFDHARSLILEANAILDELDRLQSAVSHHEALVELLAGDPADAQARLRAGYERLEVMGEKSLLATTAAMLARATYALQDYEAADRYCSISESSGAAEDLSVQVPVRGVRAKLFARSGRIEEAEALAQEAVRLIAETDMLTRHGDSLLDLAEVCRIAGRAAEADIAARDALELFNSKGNLISAAHARSLIAVAAPI